MPSNVVLNDITMAGENW